MKNKKQSVALFITIGGLISPNLFLSMRYLVTVVEHFLLIKLFKDKVAPVHL